MRTWIHEAGGAPAPELVAAKLVGEGTVLLRSSDFAVPHSRYSILGARPLVKFRSAGADCHIEHRGGSLALFGNPWLLMQQLLARYEVRDDLDVPFPLGGGFGYWGYELRNFVESRLSRRSERDLDLPDCLVYFFDSLVVWDHLLKKCWIVATGLEFDGTRSEKSAAEAVEWWTSKMQLGTGTPSVVEKLGREEETIVLPDRERFIDGVRAIQKYIRRGDLYQANLAHRLETPFAQSAWKLFESMMAVSPAPFSAYFDAGDFQLVSASPELFMKMDGSHIVTRPIKGTRPRHADPGQDARLTYELQTSAKEVAELVMITDLMRNDLGKICEYGSVQALELLKLEKFSHVQHLVSTVEGHLRGGLSHIMALESAFPGGSVTGAPKFRAMEVIDELEPVSRGPYTGAFGYLGFNALSQFSMIIRTAVICGQSAYFHVGAGIVADSDPEMEYEETLNKGAGFLAALRALNISNKTPV